MIYVPMMIPIVAPIGKNLLIPTIPITNPM